MADLYLMTGVQCRMARSLLDWSREKLADEASVARGTIRIFESDTPIRESIIMDIQSVFDANGVECLPDGSVKPRSDNIKDFRGVGGCDRFFANIEKMLQDKNTGLICRIGRQEMLSKATGRDGLSNFERLENLSKTVLVRCLLADPKIYMPGKPSFEVRIYPENRASVISSEFAYGSEVTFAVEQDPRLSFCHPAYLVVEYPNLAKTVFASFESHWPEAKPYATTTFKKPALNLGQRRGSFADNIDAQQQACCYVAC